jgi:hypothetical protein
MTEPSPSFGEVPPMSRPAGEPGALAAGARSLAGGAAALREVGGRLQGAMSFAATADAWRGPASQAFLADGTELRTRLGRAAATLDLGVFDPAGFRGWSGGARDGFAISRAGATPGYLPGPVNPGTWQVVLGPYTVAPQGLDWEVEVRLRHGPAGPAFVPDPAPERAAGRGRAWYRGDLHTHTVHSDGRRTPAELAADARAAGLDFLASTEHNTSSASLGWGAHAGPGLIGTTALRDALLGPV